MVRLSVLFILSFLFLSCEKDIRIDNKEAESLVVIEGMIETGAYPVVTVSSSLGIFSTIQPGDLSEIFIRDAEVEISNGSQTMLLKEYSFTTLYGFRYYWFSADTTGGGPLFKGEANGSYSLKVVAKGKEYTATTTIPEKGIDIVTAYAEPANLDDNPELMRMMVTLADKPGYGNYHRYFTSVNEEPFYPGLYSAGSDQLTDGATVTIALDRGVDKNSDFDLDLYPYFNKGDSVTLKFSEINYDTYEFWRSLEFNYASIGNPFSTPIKIKGNIKGGALGYFGGYAPLFYSVKIPE